MVLYANPQDFNWLVIIWVTLCLRPIFAQCARASDLGLTTSSVWPFRIGAEAESLHS